MINFQATLFALTFSLQKLPPQMRILLHHIIAFLFSCNKQLEKFSGSLIPLFNHASIMHFDKLVLLFNLHFVTLSFTVHRISIQHSSPAYILLTIQGIFSFSQNIKICFQTIKRLIYLTLFQKQLYIFNCREISLGRKEKIIKLRRMGGKSPTIFLSYFFQLR